MFALGYSCCYPQKTEREVTERATPRLSRGHPDEISGKELYVVAGVR